MVNPRKIFSACLGIAFAICLIFSLVIAASWLQDRATISSTAHQLTVGEGTVSQKAQTLLHWVYRNKGFEKNKSYFLVKKLEATPIQILQKGGDCADKSRLLVHMLRALNVPASLAMLKPCTICAPTHTVAFVKIDGVWTPMDPVYDVDFPAQGRFVDVGSLRSDPSILLKRLDALQSVRGDQDKIAYYKRGLETYDFASTVNWDKNWVTRTVARMIKAVGGAPETAVRPLFLDDPKQAIVIASLGGAAFFALAWAIVRRQSSIAGRP